MNTLSGNIVTIQTYEALSLVKVAVKDIVFTSIVIDTPETSDYLKTGANVKLYFKETEVSISKDAQLSISIQNKIVCTITAIKQGRLLSQINLSFGGLEIKSIITTDSCNKLNLKENDSILALIKTNEISLSPHD
jgi:molybdopterin-binding protein